MKFTDLKELDSSLKLISGEIASVSVSAISHSDNPLPQTFIFLKSKKFLNKVGRSSENKVYGEVGVIIEQKYLDLDKALLEHDIIKSFAWVASTESVDRAMSILSKPFYDKKYKHLNYQVDGRQMQTVKIDASAQIAQNVFIGENVTIGKNVKILPGCTILPEVEIGDNTILYPNITVYPYTKIGTDCRIHGGAVIGSDGFGYNFYNGKHNKLWHFSGVEIGDDVEIGSNTTIDCGAFTPTEIGSGSIIDNLVQVAHNVKLGKYVVACGMSGFGGSAEAGDYSAIGAGAGIGPSGRIGPGVQIAAKGSVSEGAVWEEKQVLGGYPARPVKEWMRGVATLRKLSKK